MSSQERAPAKAETNATPTFPLFPDLPPELRIQIWQDALPAIGPALYPYKLGCWEPGLRTESDRDYTPGRDDQNWLLEFRHDRLGAARLDIALVSVNTEARDVALAWAAAAAQGIEVVRGGGGTGQPVLLRNFDPERDAMYVPPADWPRFLAEELELPFGLGWDRLGRSFAARCAVARVAVPEAFFGHARDAAWRALDDLCSSFSSVEALYVVSGEEGSDMPSQGSGGRPPWRCEVDDLQGPEVVWDYETETWLPQDAGEEARTRLCDGVVQQAAQELCQGLIDWQKESFRVCKVYLVK